MTQIFDIQGSAAALMGQAVLIQGASGAGKSSLMLELMALGFTLVGDDLLMVSEKHGVPWIDAHPNAESRFEIRGIGIHQAKEQSAAALKLVVDLDHPPAARLPEPEYFEIFDHKLPKIRAKGVNGLAQYLYLLFCGKIKYMELS